MFFISSNSFARLFAGGVFEGVFFTYNFQKYHTEVMQMDFSNLPETGFSEDTEQKTREYFLNIVSNVVHFVENFRAIPDDKIFDELFLEKFILENVGLNKESLGELAPELEKYFGTGLYIWQNPKQFAKYVHWLLENAANCKSYLEIGSRWGGTFIVTCEVLRRISPNFKFAIAADLIRKTPFIERYEKIAKESGIEIIYFSGSSTSAEFAELIKKSPPDISLIDGDHSLSGALKDHMLIRKYSKIIVHHDICSDTCPESTLLWNSLKQLESGMNFIEFIEQYSSLKGNYFGIGVLVSNE
jgi:histidinol phosphatase-like PHP family hydrolase